MKTDKTDNQTADASQNCVHCGTAIHFDEKVWMDATKGEGCTDDNGNEQVHAPSMPETPTFPNSNDQLTENSWPRNLVKSIETRKRDLVIRIADWTRTKDEASYDVEFYKAGVYDWNKSHSFDASMLGKTEAKRRAIAHAQNLIACNL